MKNILFLDHDGVICLPNNWGSRYKKKKTYDKLYPDFEGKGGIYSYPINERFDNFDSKAVKVLNEIIEITDCDIVISSDWRKCCTVEEMGHYYTNQGIIKRPIGFTKDLYYTIKVPNKYYNNSLEYIRIQEINKYLSENSIEKWVAVDDLWLGASLIEGGLSNFVLTIDNEGIKQCGDKIIKFL